MKDKEQSAQDAQEMGTSQEYRERMDIDPRLNPSSDQFDPVAYQQALEAAGGLAAMLSQYKTEIDLQTFGDVLAVLSASLEASIPPADFLEALAESGKQAMGALSATLGAITANARAALTALDLTYQATLAAAKEGGLFEGRPNLLRIAEDLPSYMAALLDFFQVLEDMGDYLEAELSRPEYEGLLMRDLLQPLDDDPESTLWERALKRAEEAMKAAEPDRYQALTDNGSQAAKEDAREKKSAKDLATLAPLASMPNGEALNWLFRVFSAKGGRVVSKSPANRHEEVTSQKKGDKLRFTRVNKQSGTAAIVEIDQADKYLSKTNKTFMKVLLFTLQKMTAQNFPLEVGFSLQELIDLGMYANIDSARKAVKDFFAQQKQTTISGTVKKGKRTIKEEGGILFYHYKLQSGFVKLSVNENFNMEFIAPYFTIFPRFAYSLGNNAFSLVRYIFFLARQHSQAIKDKGTFTVSLDAVRETLGLPATDEVKNWKYKQYIITPIEEAIEEIEEALQTVPEAKEYGFTITPYGTDTTNIDEWLQGYLEIGLRGDFAETFVRLATKAEKDRDRWEKAKLTERARQAVREEAKAAKEAEKENPKPDTKGKSTPP